MSSISIAERFQQWALGDMKYVPQGRHVHARLPSVHDIADVCRGQNIDIWRFLVDRVYPAQTVKTVKGNLALKQKLSLSSYQVGYNGAKSYSHEKSQLLEEKKQLSAELRMLKDSIQLVEKDLDRCQHTLLDTESAQDHSESSIHDTQRKAQLLNVYSRVCNEEMAVYSEYTKRLLSKIDSNTNSKSQDTYFSRPAHVKGDNATIESLCTKSVRECLENISAFLHGLLRGDFSGDKTQLDKQRDRLWSRVEQVFHSQSVNEVLFSLTLLTQDGAFAIGEQTANINIVEDANKLRFQYNNASGRLMDMSEEPSDVLSVRHLVEAEQLAHIDRFMQTEKIKNESWSVSQRLEQLREEYYTKLERKYSGHLGSLELAKKCFEAQLQIAEARATVRVLTDNMARLKHTIMKSDREREDLLAKFKKIQDFEFLVESKQNLIRVLVKQNTSSKTKLESQKNQILHYLQTTVCAHEADTISMVAQLKHGIRREIEAFAGISLPYLMFTVMDNAHKIAVVDLSINRFSDPVWSAANQSIPKVLDLIKFPRFKSPEHVLFLALDMKVRVDELSDLLVNRPLTQDTGHEQAYSVEKITHMCDEVAKHNEALLGELQPSLKSRISRATQALSDCISVKDTVGVWWDQPAQHTVPWMMVDQHTLQQWRDKWTVTVTRLRQF